MVRRTTIALVVAGALAGGLVGCGSSDPDPAYAFAARPGKQILAAATKDMGSLSSVTLSGSVTTVADGLIQLDLSTDTHGNCTGSAVMYGATARFVRVDGEEYLRGTRTFWTKATGTDAGSADTVRELADRWVKLAGKAVFASFCDVRALLAQLADTGSGHATVGRVTTVAGRRAVEVIAHVGGGIAHEWVAATGTHVVLKVDQVGGDEPGELTFSGFDRPVEAHVPARYVDLGTQPQGS